MCAAIAFGLFAAPDSGLAESGDRMHELEIEIKALRQEVDALKTAGSETESGEAGTAKVETDREEIETGQIPALDLGLGIPKLVLRGFADVGYQARWIDPSTANDESYNDFAIGGMDLFITSKLGGGFGFLTETLFGFRGEETEIDVERLLLMYDYRDWLKLNAGRGHTALGYWNQYFHHGKWLQTTVDRPILYRFEDEGGILPIHFVGVELFGSVDVGPGLLSYAATLANGRGKSADTVQITEDFNSAKAAGIHLRYRPNALSGFGFGVSGYFDKIPADTSVPARALSMREYIYGAHVFYVEGGWELIAEASGIIHDDRVAGKGHHSAGSYAQVAYRFGKLKPYYRFDWLSIARADPFYADPGLNPAVEDTRQHTVGVRWDAASFVAFNLEYVHQNATSENVNAIAFQVSCAF